MPLRRGLTFTAPFGLTAEQCRRLTDDDPALRVALTLAILAGDQAAVEAGTRLLRESETRLHSVPAGYFHPSISNRATLDAERRLQMFLGGCGYIDDIVLGREVTGSERLFTPAPVHLREDGDGYSTRIADPATAPATVPATVPATRPTTEDTCRGGELLLLFAAPKETGGSRNTGKIKKSTSSAPLVARRVPTTVGVALRPVGRTVIIRPLVSTEVWKRYSWTRFQTISSS